MPSKSERKIKTNVTGFIQLKQRQDTGLPEVNEHALRDLTRKTLGADEECMRPRV